jgi:hypothetical protein
MVEVVEGDWAEAARAVEAVGMDAVAAPTL